jgi:D-glycero-D-manno-heptose 1,7-bisphosphate phosphatase
MQFVIIAGGKGSRLVKSGTNLPKSLVQVAKKKVIDYQFDAIRRLTGPKEILLILGHNSELIIEDLKINPRNLNILPQIDQELKGTYNALIQCIDLLNNEFILILGDLIMDFDFSNLIEFHKFKDSDITIVSHPNSHPFDSDLIDTDTFGEVKRILKKNFPRTGLERNLANAGVSLIAKKVLSNSKGLFKDINSDFISSAINNSFKVCNYSTSEMIMDMGTIERIKKIESLLDNKSRLQKNFAVFLDRDGTINLHKGFITNPDQIELIPGVGKAISILNNLGIKVFCITNQPVIARGDVSFHELNMIHGKIDNLLSEEDGAYINQFYFCPHHPDSGFEGEIKELKFDCECRKPKNGLIEQALLEHNLEREDCIFLGDSQSDELAAKLSNIMFIQVNNSGVVGTPSTEEAINLIVKNFTRKKL